MLTRLLAIKMQGNNLNTYIASFNHLHETTEWERDLKGMILLFRRALNPALANAVINWTIPWPYTFHEWAHAMQVQHANWVETKAVMGMQGFGWNNGFSSPHWQQALGQQNQWHNLNAMDMNAVQLRCRQMRESEWTQLWNKQWCFYCNKQGHISPYCPKKGQGCTRKLSNLNCPHPMAACAIDSEAPVEANAMVVMNRLKVLKGIHGLVLRSGVFFTQKKWPSGKGWLDFKSPIPHQGFGMEIWHKERYKSDNISGC